MANSPRPAFRTLLELEAAAAAKVDPSVWAYVQTGAGDERTLRWNREAFERRALRPRVLVDVTPMDLRTTILGRQYEAPFFIAPMAYQAKLHPDGEVGLARAAGQAGVLANFSTLSSRSLEEIAGAGDAAGSWFQLYLQPTFDATERLVQRAERAGYAALVLTVDVPVFPIRDRQMLGGFAIDEPIPVGNGAEVRPPSRFLLGGDPDFPTREDTRATWEVVDRLRSITRLPLVLKGILDPQDAERAVAHGARGLVVSNHGGRQLDGAPAALDALPEIVRTVDGRAEVYVDSGFRRGADVLIALALGARAVGIGRPALWALAADGEPGVARWIGLLKEDVATVMALAGRRNLSEIGPDLVIER